MKILDRLPILERGWMVPTPDGAEVGQAVSDHRSGQHHGRRHSANFPTMHRGSRRCWIPGIIITSPSGGNSTSVGCVSRCLHRDRSRSEVRSSRCIAASSLDSPESRRDRRAERRIPFPARTQGGTRRLSPGRGQSRQAPNPGPARHHPKRPQAHDRRRNPRTDHGIPASLMSHSSLLL